MTKYLVKIFWISVVVFIAGVLMGRFVLAENLACDPQATVKTYKFTNQPTAISSTVNAQTDGSLFLDVSAVPTGIYAPSISGCALSTISYTTITGTITNSVDVCSDPLAFNWQKSAKPLVVKGLRLIP
jgi:hypothetical protein